MTTGADEWIYILRQILSLRATQAKQPYEKHIFHALKLQKPDCPMTPHFGEKILKYHINLRFECLEMAYLQGILHVAYKLHIFT